MEQTKPSRLFRFFPLEASDFFECGKLWFSEAKDFNDLFEATPRHDALISERVEYLLKREFAFSSPQDSSDYSSFIKRMASLRKHLYAECIEIVPAGFQEIFGQHYGIACFSENLESLLMWAHYASCHQGFVVEFNLAHSVFKEGLEKVAYCNQRPFIEIEKERLILLTKSAEWKYEAEHRLIRLISTLKLGTRRDGKEKRYLELPPDSVHAVYFGCRMPDLNRDDMLKSLKSKDWNHVSRFLMRRHHTDFAVVPTSWEQFKLPSQNLQKLLNDYNAFKAKQKSNGPRKLI